MGGIGRDMNRKSKTTDRCSVAICVFQRGYLEVIYPMSQSRSATIAKQPLLICLAILTIYIQFDVQHEGVTRIDCRPIHHLHVKNML